MLQLILRSLRGQRRNSALLSAIIALSFLFLSLTMAVSDSISYTRQLENEALFGRHQALYLGSEAAVEALSEAVEGVYSGPIVGKTLDAQTVGVMDEALQTAGNFRLAAGRLPQAANEILVVGSQLGDYAVGDQLQLIYDYSYLQDPDAPTKNSAFSDMLTKALDSNPAYREIMAQNWDAIYDTDRVRSYTEPEARKPYAELNEAQRLTVDLTFAVQWIPEVKYTGSAMNGNPYSDQVYDSLTVRYMTSYSDIRLTGSAYGEAQGQALSGEPRLNGLVVYADYTVCGVLEDYTALWSAEGLQLPTAFVGKAGQTAIETVQRDAEAAYPDVLPIPRAALALLSNPDAEKTAYFQDILQAYQSLPSYRLEGCAMLHGQVQGFVVGRDQSTGEEVTIPIKGNGTNGTLTSGWSETEREGYVERSQFYAEDLTDPAFRFDLIDPIIPEARTLEEQYWNNSGPLQFNFLTYPLTKDATANTEWVLTRLLMLLAACATFQIYLHALRRRSTRIQTLIAIGATDAQLVFLLLSETVLLLIPAALAGVALGLGIAWAITQYGMHILFTVDASMLAGSIGLTALSILLGTLLPIFSIFPRKTRRKAARTVSLQPKPIVYAYRSIVRRYALVNRKSLLLQTAILLLTAVSCLLPFFLSNRAYAPWRESVVHTARPDYALTLPYAVSGRYLDEILADFPLEDTTVEAYVSGDKILLGSEAVAGSLHYPADIRVSNGQGDLGVEVQVLAADWDSALVQGIVAQLPETISQQAFTDGTDCILLAPRVRGDVQSFLPLHSDFQADPAATVGLPLTLTGTTQTLKNDGAKLETDYYTATTQVAAVVSSLETPVWPLETTEGWTILGSPRLLASVYPRASRRMTVEEVRHFRVASELYYPYCYGETQLQLRMTAAPANLGAYEVQLAHWAAEYGMEIVNYRRNNELLYTTAEQAELLYLLLTVSVALIAVILLGNLYTAELELNQRRLGILQACGLTNGQFLRHQWAGNAARCGAILLGVNLVYLLLYAIPAVRLAFEGYRWGVHILVCALFLLGLPLLQACVSLPILRRNVKEKL